MADVMTSGPLVAGTCVVCGPCNSAQASASSGGRSVETFGELLVRSSLRSGNEGYPSSRGSRLCVSVPNSWGTQLPPSRSLYRRNSPSNPWSAKTNASRSVCPGIVLAFSDPDLHSVLEVASDAELLDLSNILYGKSFLSPLIKSFTPGDGSRGEHITNLPHKNLADRDALMVRLETRFFFLAADARSTLSGHRPSYRNVLLQVREKLQISFPEYLSTEDMESEIFLHLLQQYSRKKVAPAQASPKALKIAPLGPKKNVRGRHWWVTLPVLMKLRGKEFVSTVLKGGGAMTICTLQQMVSKRLSGKVLLETARYQLASEAVVKTAQVAAMLETRVAVLAARQGLIGAVKRYLTLQSAVAVLGPMLWGTLLADMLISAVGTDYARILRAIYAVAQIRLVRTYSWDDTNQIL